MSVPSAKGKRHKVLLFIPNLQQGGAERQILELMTRLPARFEPTLCLYEDVVHYREYLPPGEPRHVLGASRMGPRGLRRLVEVLRVERPDILHSYRDKANFWARLATRKVSVPVVITAVRSRAMHVVHLATEWWLSERSDRVIANSEGVRRELVGLAGVAPEKI
ncbi:MAG TPA: glycosyltransferase, partial [Polyangia bacterium]|nr:glycosyltransferase [Polyangia bacterium]